MGILKNGKFWGGVIVGTIVGQLVIGKVAPGLKAKLPG